jgi:acyl carrier protein
MSKAEFVIEIEKLFELPLNTLSGNEALTDYPWDSLAMTEFIMLCDEHFGVTVPPTALRECKTVDDLVNLVVTYLEE